ncbi:hypothetical protein [Pseudochrobactrum sp. XF203]|uniref:hypothetical protein n=1 Tax=Pseudochrobactrum sp. XF203 TaxID=2879116 RepID=UPI001CE2C9CC|nr:hypothetical protein [Pseudochrobactrum sp. XF203]UCA47617.1 hypothetical protein LDL70_16315 [Pseudochrobactrum sp. XF203]
MAAKWEKLLILCKTYPSPSGKYAETSCVAAINEQKQFVRLYPIPFRLIRKQDQFKKWQWARIQINKAKKDHRPESHTVNVDAISCDPEAISTKNNWKDRRAAIEGACQFTSFDDLEEFRAKHNTSLAFLKPRRIIELLIIPVQNPNWTDLELNKLLRRKDQSDLFDSGDETEIKLLRKLPYDFYYRYICDVNGEEKEYKHKIVDWEVGALYWNCVQKHKEHWEKPFRDQMVTFMSSRDLIFFMGNMHQYQWQWLIISLIYPPKDLPIPTTGDLFGSF